MRRLISVTKQNIRDGESSRWGDGKTDPCECPVARAIRESLGYTVAAYGAGVYCQRWEQSVPAPRSVRRFIRRFDVGGPRAVKPFSFYLTLP